MADPSSPARSSGLHAWSYPALSLDLDRTSTGGRGKTIPERTAGAVHSETEGQRPTSPVGNIQVNAPAALPPAGSNRTGTREAAAEDAWAETHQLRRGVNITAWFRYPASRDPGALKAYLSDQALADLKSAGFDFVRLAIDPALAETQPATLITAIRRIQKQGLTVVVSPHPQDWHLESSTGDRARLRAFWGRLAAALRELDSARTLPEVLNEPVFRNDAAGWAVLQHGLLAEIRRALPKVTVVLTGQDWGSIGGLSALRPEDDANVLYSFHFYDPPELTALASYRQGLDRAALSDLPFPVEDRQGCETIADRTGDTATREIMRYYCAPGWDRPRIVAAIDVATAWARHYHVHLLAGEFGASADLNAPARLAWLRTVRDALESDGVAWALWGYDDVMGLNVTRPPARRPTLDRAVLTALGMSTRM